MIKYFFHFSILIISLLTFIEKGFSENVKMQSDSLSFEEREKELLDSIENHPENQELYRKLGMHYREYKFYEKSFESYNKSLSILENYLAYIGRGITYLETGDTVSALKDFDMAISVNPNDTSYTNRAFYRIGINSVDSILSDLNMAIYYNPQNESAVQFRTSLYHLMEMFDSSKTGMEILKNLNPSNPYPYFLQADFSFMEESYLNALSNIDKAIELDKEPDNYFLLRGKINYSLEKFAEAVKDFRRYENYESSDTECKYYLGLSYFYIDNYLSTIKCLQQVDKLDSAYLDAYGFYALAYSYLEENDTVDAIKYVKKSLALGYENSNALNLYGTILHYKKNYKEAEKYLKEAVKYDKDNFLYYLSVAALYEDMKRYDDAIEYLKLAKARNLERAEEYEILISKMREDKDRE